MGRLAEEISTALETPQARSLARRLVRDSGLWQYDADDLWREGARRLLAQPALPPSAPGRLRGKARRRTVRRAVQRQLMAAARDLLARQQRWIEEHLGCRHSGPCPLSPGQHAEKKLAALVARAHALLSPAGQMTLDFILEGTSLSIYARRKRMWRSDAARAFTAGVRELRRIAQRALRDEVGADALKAFIAAVLAVRESTLTLGRADSQETLDKEKGSLADERNPHE